MSLMKTNGLIDSLKDSKSEEDRKKCIPLLKEYLRENPNNAVAWYDLAGCHDFIGEELEAEPCYRKTLELGYENLPLPEQPGFFVGFGSTLRNNKKLQDSKEVLEKGIKAFPDYPALKVFLAFTLHSLGEYRKASEVLLLTVGNLENKNFDGYERAIKWYSENLES